MAQEIYHRSEWGNPNEQWGNVYLNADLTNELYKRASEYENSWVTDQLLNGVGTKPSIILTPTAYEDGILNSVKPKGGENFITYSEDFSQWSINDLTLESGYLAPDGSTNAYKVTRTATNAYIVQSGGVSGNDARTIYAKTVSGSGTLKLLSHNTNTNNIFTITEQWQRFEVNSTPSVGSNFYAIDFRGAASTLTEVIIWGAQSERGSRATTYIKTEGTAIKNGDFSFTRGSSATRVSENGLIQDVQILSGELVQNGNFEQIGTEEVSNGDFSQIGSELVTNGGFDTDSDWVKGTGTTISGGNANFVNATGVSLYQNIGTQSGTVKVEFTVTNYTSGTLNVYSGGNQSVGVVNVSANALGTYTVYVDRNGGNVNIIFGSSDNFTGSIDNVSVKEVGQDWTLENNAIINNVGVNIIGVGSRFRQDVLTVGKSYKLQYEVVSTNGASFRFQDGTTAFSDINQTIGFHTYYFKATDVRVQFQAVGDINATIDNVSVKEVGQNWTFFGEAEFTDDGARIYSSSGGQSYINQSILTNTKKYRLSYEITDSTTGSLKLINVNGLSDYPIPSTVGTHTLDFIANNSTFFIYRNSGATDVTIDNISVVEVTDDTDLPRINYTNFDYKDVLGDELVTNGSFDTNSDWSKYYAGDNNSITITNGVLSFDSNTNQNVNQTISSSNLSGFYKLTYTITSYTRGNPYLLLGGGSNIYLGSTLGTHTKYVQGGGSNANLIIYGGIFNQGGELSIDNVSVKELTKDVVVPYSGEGSLLLEPQRTNLSTYSEDFSNAAWIKNNVSINTNDAVSPDGSLNASSIVGDGSTSYHWIQKDSGSGISGKTYTVSFFAKKGSLNFLQLVLDSSVFGIMHQNFDLENGVIGSSSGSATPFIKNYGNGWYRLGVTATATSSNIIKPLIALANSNTMGRYGSFGTSGNIKIYGVQAEEGSFPTSYIKTTSAAVTRLADVCNNSGSSDLINSTEGVLYAEISALANDLTNRFISISNGSKAERVEIGYSNVSNKIFAFSNVGNVNQCNIGFVLPNMLDYNKIALKYKLNDFSLWVNGVKVGVDLNASVSAQNTLNELAFDEGDGTDVFYSKTKCVAVFKEALSDTELQKLTTI